MRAVNRVRLQAWRSAGSMRGRAGAQAASAQRPRHSRTWLPATVLFVPATLCDGTRECVRCQSAQPGGARLAVSSSRR